MPQAILTQDVEKLGERGEVVDVSKGYLRNYLIPRKLAEPATKGSIEAAQRRKQAAERAVADAQSKAQESAELLNKTVLTIPHQAGEDGRLFGSVTAQDIADAIKEARGLTIDRHDITLGEPIKTARTPMGEGSAHRPSRSARAWSKSRSRRVLSHPSRPWSSKTSNASGVLRPRFATTSREFCGASRNRCVDLA